jgi:hypothetical protein
MAEVYAGPFGMFTDLPGSAPRKDGPVEVLKAGTLELDRFVPKRKLRRMDHYSRMALLAAGRALHGMDPSLTAKGKTGLIVATGYGALNSTFLFLDSYIEKGDKLSAPTHFSGSVHNSAAAHISICYGITGPCLTVSQFDLSFASALITAGTWLETGKADTVLVGAVDEWCEVAGYCMDKMAESSDTSLCSFGEGASFFLVTRQTEKPPEYGYFEDISIGQDLFGPALVDMDVIFSPSSLAPCRSGDIEALLNRTRRVLVRCRGGSPTDMGMDALFAFSENHQTGGRICCMKQGEDGMFARVTIGKCQ